jgi:hypothetical protein
MARLDDGFSTRITFSADSQVAFWEKEITPPGLEAGGEIDTTTMANSTWRTKKPKSLVTLAECSFTAAYDAVVYDDILTMLGVNQQITITFPDGATLVFWGWVDSFVPNALVEGEQPTAEVTIIPSNQNNSNVETAPDYTAPSA